MVRALERVLSAGVQTETIPVVAGAEYDLTIEGEPALITVVCDDGLSLSWWPGDPVPAWVATQDGFCTITMQMKPCPDDGRGAGSISCGLLGVEPVLAIVLYTAWRRHALTKGR